MLVDGDRGYSHRTTEVSRQDDTGTETLPVVPSPTGGPDTVGKTHTAPLAATSVNRGTPTGPGPLGPGVVVKVALPLVVILPPQSGRGLVVVEDVHGSSTTRP